MRIDLDLLRRKIWFKPVRCYEVKESKSNKRSGTRAYERYIVKTDVPKEVCNKGIIITTFEDLKALMFKMNSMRRAVLKKNKAWEDDDGLLHVEYVVIGIKGKDRIIYDFDRYIKALKLIKAKVILGVNTNTGLDDESILLIRITKYKQDIEQIKKLYRVDRLYSEIISKLQDIIEVPY